MLMKLTDYPLTTNLRPKLTTNIATSLTPSHLLLPRLPLAPYPSSTPTTPHRTPRAASPNTRSSPTQRSGSQAHTPVKPRVQHHAFSPAQRTRILPPTQVPSRQIRFVVLPSHLQRYVQLATARDPAVALYR
ncbi:hypothetical protein PSPO01_07271 [Paraphaeosphaeria sporulosa]